MRYVVMGLILFFLVFLTSAVFVQMPILGVELNWLLAGMSAMVLLEKGMIPGLIAGGGALLMDALFARAMGFYSMPMLAAGLAVYILGTKIQSRRLYMPVAAGALGWLVCELLTMLLCVFVGEMFDLGTRLVNTTLPGLVLQGALTFLLYLLLYPLYQKGFMRPTRMDEDDLLGMPGRGRRFG